MANNLAAIMMRHSIDDIRSAYIARVQSENELRADARNWIRDVLGYSEIPLDTPTIDTTDAEYTADGRVVLRAQGKLWAISADKHSQYIAEAMEQARQRDAALAEQQPQQSQLSQPATPPTICTSLIDGQLCGGNLVMTPVCPNCALGKSGVAATLTCDVCGHVSAIMRGDQ